MTLAVATKKKCAKCNRSKPVGAFNRHRRYSDGLQPWCAECQHTHYYGTTPLMRRGTAYTVRDRAFTAFDLILECLEKGDQDRIPGIIARAKGDIA